jgi:uncharacterized protein (DUF736 family)
MTKQYDNELRGALFKNKDKDEGDSKPDYTGNAQIEGVDYFMDAWINTSESGRKYMSVKFKAKKAQANPPAREPRKGGYSRDDNDDPRGEVPF